MSIPLTAALTRTRAVGSVPGFNPGPGRQSHSLSQGTVDPDSACEKGATVPDLAPGRVHPPAAHPHAPACIHAPAFAREACIQILQSEHHDQHAPACIQDISPGREACIRVTHPARASVHRQPPTRTRQRASRTPPHRTRSVHPHRPPGPPNSPPASQAPKHRPPKHRPPNSARTHPSEASARPHPVRARASHRHRPRPSLACAFTRRPSRPPQPAPRNLRDLRSPIRRQSFIACAQPRP